MDICTIIASNYAPFARVLGESFREHHPEARCFVLVIDDHEGRLDPASEPFEIITPAELGIEQFDRMATTYNVLELSTAVKPWLLKHLLNERGCETLSYLDPDIQVIDRLDEIEELLHEHRLVVTPHLTAPMPRDGRKPSETDILIAGSFNLGFVGMARGEDIDALLDWWAERLETDCIVAPERGFFVDQRWMDFAPGLVPSFHVLRDPGYNVAYWNLASRKVERAGDRWTVNGRPLRFFHFSGFDPERPDLLSKHQDRIRLDEEPGVRELCTAYGERLLGHGYREAKDWTYTYDRLPGGTPIDAAVRLGYRHAVEGGELPRSPLTERGARELVRWLAQDTGPGTPNRYLLALHEARPDLQRAFPEVPGEDAGRFTVWAQTFGRTEIPIPAALVPGADPDAAPGAAAPATLGVNVAGYFESVLGVGEAARQVVGALEAVGTAIAPVGLVASNSRQDAELGVGTAGAASRSGRHPVNLICVNADALPYFADEVGPDFFTGRYSIGLWWWEVSSFPEQWLGSFAHLDEVWVGSRHVADALAPVSPVPVVHVVQPVTVADAEPLDRAALGIPEGFLFLFSFDYNSVFQRKNPLAVIDAFTRAFEPGSGQVLVIKSINHEHDEAAHERLRAAAAAHPDVHLVDRYVSRAERDALTAGCDCYVSLHRSEGFGFTVAEAMAYGRPVITTAYGGTMDFTTPGNAYLVDYELVPIGPNAEPYPQDGVWADPDVEQAAALMREVVAEPDAARRRGERARADIRERHAPAVAGRVMADRLARVSAGFGAAAAAPGRELGAFDPRPIRERISRGPHTPERYRFGAPQRAARKALLRGMKPFAVHEKAVDNDLLRSLEAVDRAVQTLAQSHAAAMRGASPARVDDLVGQVDRLRADLDAAMRFLASFGLGGPAQIARAQGLGLGDWPVAPAEPWTPEYVERHREFVTRALDDPSLLVALRAGRELPPGYGAGFDERVVEFPWTVTRDLRGRVLDAGSTLNHPHVLIRVRPHVDELHVVTLAPEQEAYPFLDVSYLYADLRELPMQDATYDTAVSISTLEHVGMDNAQYGDASPRSADAAAGRAAAMAELHRVLKPGGSLFVTVPYGRPDDLGWQQIFDAAGLQALVDAFGGTELDREFFRYEAAGWRRASQAEADGAVYKDHFADPAPAADRAPAARAIACLRLRREG